MAINKLTDRRVKAFLAERQAGRKAFDGDGLFLTLTAAGSAIWRIKYRVDGKERLYTVGPYPDITIEAARIERTDVRALLREGRDPVTARRLDRAAVRTAEEVTFQRVAEDWLAKQQPAWSATHYRKTTQALERDIFPALGALPVARITPAMVASAAQQIVDRGARESAAKALWSCRGIFELAQARGLCRDNPAVPARAVLPRKQAEQHLPALTAWPAIGAVLAAAERANVTRVVYMAHRLIAFTAARISNAVAAEWREFDLDAAVPMWTVPRDKMKSRHDRTHDHKFVLGPQIVQELRDWQRLVGSEGHLFPSPTGRPHITRESVEKAYRVTLGLGDRHTPHGWRASFSTLARDHGFPRDVVEIALDHVHDNEVARAYDRGERLQERVQLAHWWGERLTAAQRAAGVS